MQADGLEAGGGFCRSRDVLGRHSGFRRFSFTFGLEFIFLTDGHEGQLSESRGGTDHPRGDQLGAGQGRAARWPGASPEPQPVPILTSNTRLSEHDVFGVPLWLLIWGDCQYPSLRTCCVL